MRLDFAHCVLQMITSSALWQVRVVVRGRGRTADLPLFRRIRGVAASDWMRPDERSSWGNHGSPSPSAARRLPTLTPRLAPQSR
jgi:hypothetical protein